MRLQWGLTREGEEGTTDDSGGPTLLPLQWGLTREGEEGLDDGDGEGAALLASMGPHP